MRCRLPCPPCTRLYLICDLSSFGSHSEACSWFVKLIIHPTNLFLGEMDFSISSKSVSFFILTRHAFFSFFQGPFKESETRGKSTSNHGRWPFGQILGQNWLLPFSFSKNDGIFFFQLQKINTFSAICRKKTGDFSRPAFAWSRKMIVWLTD